MSGARSAGARRLPAIAALSVSLGATSALYMRYVATYLASGAASRPLPGDFGVYLRAWQRVAAGADPYVAAEYSSFKYSPGFLAALRWLPREPARAWIAFGTMSLLALFFALWAGARYRGWKQVACLALGLSLAWKGLIETLDYGQAELLILGIAAGAAWSFRRAPGLSGFLLGILPGFKLPWALLALPYFAAARIATPSARKRRGPLPRWIAGYFAAWFTWAAALPSLTFGPERAQTLSESWLALLRSQPSDLFRSDFNQSLWIAAIRAGERWGPAGRLAALGLACVIAGFLAGQLFSRLPRLVDRSTRRPGSRAPAQPALARMTPWLLFTQLVNPLAWRWGSVFALGAGFSALPDDSVPLRFGKSLRAAALASLIALLWLLQLNPVVKLLGLRHWTDLHPYGIITAYWLALLVLVNISHAGIPGSDEARAGEGDRKT